MEHKEFSAYTQIYHYNRKSRIRQWLLFLSILFILILFLPWTQNIRAKGKVTALRQEHRPQELHALIGGRVEKWYVKEGDYVKKGDTILHLSEIKADYLDPQLLQRTADQIQAKQRTMDYYQDKINAAGTQMNALVAGLQAKRAQLANKLVQLEVKLQSDSAAMVAAEQDFSIADRQYKRQRAMLDSGLVSLTQLEQRQQSFQQSQAKNISARNSFLNTKQEMGIVKMELNAVEQDYNEKLAKVQGEQFSSLSEVATSQGELAKLQNQYSSYSIRNGMYYVLAPQSGQIVQAQTAGIGEVVKEGELMVEMVPDEIEYAVELFVRPLDLPLISQGQTVKFLFDGFPAIVFSGWPQASYGIYSGKVVAVESSVGSNGKFKILVKEDPDDRPWPRELKMGTGANGIALLKTVPVWYELWRNINAFPPDYYQGNKKE